MPFGPLEKHYYDACGRFMRQHGKGFTKIENDNLLKKLGRSLQLLGSDYPVLFNKYLAIPPDTYIADETKAALELSLIHISILFQRLTGPDL